jgi:hypothetical protein
VLISRVCLIQTEGRGGEGRGEERRGGILIKYVFDSNEERGGEVRY